MVAAIRARISRRVMEESYQAKVTHGRTCPSEPDTDVDLQLATLTVSALTRHLPEVRAGETEVKVRPQGLVAHIVTPRRALPSGGSPEPTRKLRLEPALPPTGTLACACRCAACTRTR